MIDEYDNSGNVISEYVYFGLRPVALKNNGSLNIVHTDYLSTPRSVTSGLNGGSVIWQWKNDNPYGYNSATGIEFNLRFAGQYYDSESGLHYNMFRTYNPELGRYMQSDPIGLNGGFNTYNYVNKNPLDNVDPLGLRDLNFNDDTSSHSTPINGLYSNSNTIPGVTRVLGHGFAIYTEDGNINGFVIGLNSPAMIELREKNPQLYNEVSKLTRCPKKYFCSSTSVMVDGALLAKMVKNLEPNATTIILTECYAASVNGVGEFARLYPNAFILGSSNSNFIGIDENNKHYIVGSFLGNQNELDFNDMKAKLTKQNPSKENIGKSIDTINTEIFDSSQNMLHGLGGFIKIGK